MKGAREQLLDIKSKTQYPSSRWSSVTHVHTARELNGSLAGRGTKFVIFMRTTRQFLLAKMLSLPYILVLGFLRIIFCLRKEARPNFYISKTVSRIPSFLNKILQ